MRKRGKLTVWNGVEYPSRLACAEALGIHPYTLYKRLNAGQTCDEDIRPRRKPVMGFSSQREAAKALGIHEATLSKRLTILLRDEPTLLDSNVESGENGV